MILSPAYTGITTAVSCARVGTLKGRQWEENDACCKSCCIWRVCFCRKKYSRGVWNHRIQGQEDLMWEWVKKWSDNSEPFVLLQVSDVNLLHFWSCFCCCTVVIYSIDLTLFLFYVSLLAYIWRTNVPDQTWGEPKQTYSFLHISGALHCRSAAFVHMRATSLQR